MTARCILKNAAGKYLLVVHHDPFWWTRPPFQHQRWGLPGGRIERGEAPIEAARRELSEELNIEVDGLAEVGEFPYKGRLHAVFAGQFDGEVKRYDIAEIFAISWLGLDQIRTFASRRQLHAGFEVDAIERMESLGIFDRSS